MRELVCLDLPLGQTFVDRVRRAWDEGDAIFPLDQRLPLPARQAVMAAARPTLVCDGNGDTVLEGLPVEAGDSVVVTTSGSTGTPKAVVLTQTAVESSALAVHARLGVTSSDHWFACLPPAHVGGLSVVLRSIVTGIRLTTAPSFSPEHYVNAAQEGATLVSLVATALGRVDPALYRTIVLGGSRPPQERPANTVTTYGMTETGSGVVYDGIPLEGVEIDIRDGVIHLRCPMLMRGYRDSADGVGPDGWYRTGDIGRFLPDGRLHVEGREGDLIITGGENVWPEQVEQVLSTMSGVEDCCVVGVADPEWGHAVHVFAVLTSGRDVSLEQMREHVKSALPAHCAPKALHVVGSIPRTALGKPQRSVLVASVGPDLR